MTSVIPGRIVRVLAISTMQSLSLKQVFVRFVSHEIRSPLNVVLAGLELLRSDLNIGVKHSIFDLIDDMQSAAETAITILNDLLNYEHMDAGTDKYALQYLIVKLTSQARWSWSNHGNPLITVWPASSSGLISSLRRSMWICPSPTLLKLPLRLTKLEKYQIEVLFL